MKQAESEKLFEQWLLKGKFVKNGFTYTAGINTDSAIKALIPDDYKMTGFIYELPSKLTLSNADLDDDYHEGFTIGKGKTLYWMLIWHKSGHCTVFSREGVKPRWINGDTIITVHFKQQL